jgi:hypothetical protein
VGPRAGLDGCGKSRPHRDSIHRPSSLHTDYGIPAPFKRSIVLYIAITAVWLTERLNALWKERTTFRGVRLTARSDYQIRHTVYVCPSSWTSASTGRIFTKSDILSIFRNISRKLKFH